MDMFYVIKNPLCSGYVWNKLFKNIIEREGLCAFLVIPLLKMNRLFLSEYICKQKYRFIRKNMYASTGIMKMVLYMKKNFTEKKVKLVSGSREDVWKICNIEKNVMIKF